MTDFNSLLIEKINNRRKEENDKCDALITSAKDSKSYIDTFLLIQEFYGNTLEQSELQIKLLEENLVSEFFVNNVAKKYPNHITYEDNDFKVSFPTSRVKEIIVEYKNGFCYFPLAEKAFYYQNIYDVIMEYKKNSNLNNIRKVIEVTYNNSSKLWLFKFIETVKLLRNDLVIKNIQEQLNIYNKRKNQDQIEKERFKKNQQIANDFLDSLSELKDFTDKGFRIRYKRIEKNGSFEF
jgi:hypothetical protein